MPQKTQWEGKTKGSLRGHKVFVFLLNTFGLRVCYFFLNFVAFYYFLFSESKQANLNYFKNIHGYKGLKAQIASYRCYVLFGEIILDKVALLSGVKTKFSIEHEGQKENLSNLKSSGKGSILLSAHIGNWEIAGQMLEVLDTKFNILMYDNEAAQMKEYMNKIMGKKSFHIIPIRDGEMGHLVQLHKAFSNNELVVMHGDRFLPGAPTIEKDFMGKKALFPAGPFVMAAKFGVPVTLVFAVKESRSHYHFFARKPIEIKRARTAEEVEKAVVELSDIYVKEVEQMVKRYPLQWFNFYDFWKD